MEGIHRIEDLKEGYIYSVSEIDESRVIGLTYDKSKILAIIQDMHEVDTELTFKSLEFRKHNYTWLLTIEAKEQDVEDSYQYEYEIETILIYK